VPGTDDEQSRAIAAQIERDNPRWMVVFGTFTRQFVCFPLFPAPPGTMVAAKYPPAIPERLKETEHWLLAKDKSKPRALTRDDRKPDAD
jgi:hypothetical protein